jgi:hypothetical protein
MPTLVYQCDICKTTFPTLQEAEECEALPTPEPPPWLKPGATVWGFGENGVEGPGKVQEVFYRKGDWPKSPHRLYLWTDHNISGHGISHNYVGEDPLPANAVDPMQGWDFLRYVSYTTMRDHARGWKEACVALEIEPDPTQAKWFRTDRSQHLVFAETVENEVL